jgi:hypothetical protein
MSSALSKLMRRCVSATFVAAAALLASCGGGGGDATPAAPAFPLSASLANVCTLDGQQKFVRSFLDEIYLWYDEIPAIKASDFATVPGYFNALLVKTPDANGQPRDRFSVALSASAANGLQPPRFSDALGSGVPSDLLQASGNSVPLARVVNSPNGRKVGYILFNDHNEGAQDALIAAFESLRSAGVSELVLDMRYNTGGFLYVAQAAASMVTGPRNEGRIFEQLRFNKKRQAESASSVFSYSSRVQTAETVYPTGTPLPQLDLPRLYVLSSGQTCSASESIINSLRGIDIDVILVGGTTCGKPYGFHRQDNCALAFYAIEFQGYNAKNFGDYTSGFRAACPVADDLRTPLGNATEPLLAAALHHIDTGSCPAAATGLAGLLAQGQPGGGRQFAPSASPSAWDGRLLRGPSR